MNAPAVSPATVGDALRANGAAVIAARLPADILECEAGSVVGEACVALAIKVAAALAVEASDGGCVEGDVRESFVDATVRQCSVWYFG